VRPESPVALDAAEPAERANAAPPVDAVLTSPPNSPGSLPEPRGPLAAGLQALLDADRPTDALELGRGVGAAELDEVAAQLLMVAGERCGRFDAVVDVVEARLSNATQPAEIRALALTGGRIARDVLRDDDRAAALLYQAHEAAPEDIEIRLELTAVYARIPRLAAHAVTGILQLLRRAPDDARIFALAGNLADHSGQAERATAMRATAGLLNAQTPGPEPAFRADAPTRGIVALDEAAVVARLAPTGWGGAAQRLLAVLAPHLEEVFGRPVEGDGMEPLAQVSPRSLALAERADRILPGRVVQLMVADVDQVRVGPGDVPSVVLPRVFVAHDALLFAAIARGLAVVRWNAVVTEALGDGEAADLRDVLHGALSNGGARDPRAQALRARLGATELKAAQALWSQVSGADDLEATARLLARACDRLALVATGAIWSSLVAGPLPALLHASPVRQAKLLRDSARGLDLIGFSARDNVWLARRERGF
jgi:hypothetical protein